MPGLANQTVSWANITVGWVNPTAVVLEFMYLMELDIVLPLV